jgi:hypothetical protein
MYNKIKRSWEMIEWNKMWNMFITILSNYNKTGKLRQKIKTVHTKQFKSLEAFPLFDSSVY